MTFPLALPAPKTPSERAAEYFSGLESQCAAVLRSSLTEPNLTSVANSHIFTNELQEWCEVLSFRREVELLRVAALEYEFGLLALVQGHYRNSFKSLRLCLELTLQTVHLSSNELILREWLSNRVDTSWSAITDEKQGVFSARFSKAFFKELEQHAQHHAGMAVLLYRESSECVHGNIPRHISIPQRLGFDQGTFNLWHGKARILQQVAHFALALRYFNDLTEANRRALKAVLLARLAHIQEVRLPLAALV